MAKTTLKTLSPSTQCGIARFDPAHSGGPLPEVADDGNIACAVGAADLTLNQTRKVLPRRPKAGLPLFERQTGQLDASKGGPRLFSGTFPV